MDSLTHNVRRANWLNIINQCQERNRPTMAERQRYQREILLLLAAQVS